MSADTANTRTNTPPTTVQRISRLVLYHRLKDGLRLAYPEWSEPRLHEWAAYFCDLLERSDAGSALNTEEPTLPSVPDGEGKG